MNGVRSALDTPDGCAALFSIRSQLPAHMPRKQRNTLKADKQSNRKIVIFWYFYRRSTEKCPRGSWTVCSWAAPTRIASNILNLNLQIAFSDGTISWYSGKSVKYDVESITLDNTNGIHPLAMPKIQIIILCRLFVYSGWFSWKPHAGNWIAAP